LGLNVDYFICCISKKGLSLEWGPQTALQPLKKKRKGKEKNWNISRPPDLDGKSKQIRSCRKSEKRGLLDIRREGSPPEPATCSFFRSRAANQVESTDHGDSKKEQKSKKKEGHAQSAAGPIIPTTKKEKHSRNVKKTFPNAGRSRQTRQQSGKKSQLAPRIREDRQKKMPRIRASDRTCLWKLQSKQERVKSGRHLAPACLRKNRVPGDNNASPQNPNTGLGRTRKNRWGKDSLRQCEAHNHLVRENEGVTYKREKVKFRYEKGLQKTGKMAVHE